MPKQPLTARMAAGETLRPGDAAALTEQIEVVPIEAEAGTPAG